MSALQLADLLETEDGDMVIALGQHGETEMRLALALNSVRYWNSDEAFDAALSWEFSREWLMDDGPDSETMHPVPPNTPGAVLFTILRKSVPLVASVEHQEGQRGE